MFARALLFIASLKLASALALGCSITGRVVDPEGKPVRFAAVSIFVRGASTDAEGVYCIPDAPPGNYTLRASAPWRDRGNCGVTYDLAPHTQPVRVGTEPVTLNITLRRQRTFCVEGHVPDRGEFGMSIRSDVWSATVFHKGGRFRIRNLHPGTYTLVVSHLGRVYAEHNIRVVDRNLSGVVIKTRTASSP